MSKDSSRLLGVSSGELKPLSVDRRNHCLWTSDQAEPILSAFPPQRAEIHSWGPLDGALYVSVALIFRLLSDDLIVHKM